MFEEWEPLADPARGLASVRRWHRLLQADGGGRVLAAGDGANAPLEALLSELLLPPLRSTITNRWDPRECEPLVSLLEGWEGVLPERLLRYVLQHLVLPRLQSAVQQWDPRTDTVPIHSWMHPWLPLLRAELEPLYVPLRHKLSVALQQWHPRDGSAMLLLQPWRPVWGEKDWDLFCVRWALASRRLLPRPFSPLSRRGRLLRAAAGTSCPSWSRR